MSDFKYALRSLAKSPGLTAAAIVTLALGIGLNAAVFPVVDAAVFRPLPYANPAELLRVVDTNPSRHIPRFSSSPPNFMDWRAQNSTLASMAAYSNDDDTLIEGSEPQRIRGEAVSPALFPMLGVEPALGRVFRPEEEQPGQPPSILLSWDFWQRRFGGDRAIVNRQVRFEGGSRTVAGVMPRGFRFPTSRDNDAWTPLVLDAKTTENRGAHWLGVVARRKANVSVEQAQADLSAIAARLEAAYPGARRSDVLRLFVREAIALAAAGIAVGLALAAAATKLLSGMLFGIRPTDPLTYLAVSLLLSLAVLAATSLPAGRAARISPIEALRHE